MNTTNYQYGPELLPGTIWRGKPGQRDRKIVRREDNQIFWIPRGKDGTFNESAKPRECWISTMADFAKSSVSE